MGALFGAIAYVFGYILEFWVNIVGNYGWAVILFSITIKAIVFPLTIKQQKSLKKNQELQPKLAELQQKYGNNQQQMSIEYQKFVKENNYHPFGGCLLTILQILMLIGVFFVVANPIKYMEKCSDEEINVLLKEAIINHQYSGDKEVFAEATDKYITDNSGDKFIKEYIEKNPKATNEEIYIAAYERSNRYYELEILKDRYDLSFFNINLGDITAQNPGNLRLWIFPVLTVIFYYISLIMLSKKQKKQVVKDPNGNEIQMPNMMMMNLMMPLLSGWISYSVPQGMGLYWFMNSLLQIIIQFASDKFFDKDKKEDNNITEKVLKSVDPIVEKTEEVLENSEENQDSQETVKKQNPNSSKKHKKKKKK